jgi:hypothetical protein
VEANDRLFFSGGDEMIVYKVFCKAHKLKKDDLIGVLTERRNDLRGETQLESGLKWARFFFTDLVKERRTIFVLPNDVEVRK